MIVRLPQAPSGGKVSGCHGYTCTHDADGHFGPGKEADEAELSLRKISNKLVEAGHLNARGQPFAAQSIKNMIA